MSIYDPITTEPCLDPPEPNCSLCLNEADLICSNCDMPICGDHVEFSNLCSSCALEEEEDA